MDETATEWPEMGQRGDIRRTLAKALERLFFMNLLFTGGMILAMHILEPPYLEPFRAPSDLRRTADIWGLPWPQAMLPYHITLAAMIGTMVVNGLGLRRLSSMRWAMACRASAFIGAVFAAAVLLYFSLEFAAERPFTHLDHQSAAIFSTYASFLLAVHVMTFLVTTPLALRPIEYWVARRKGFSAMSPWRSRTRI